MSVAYGYAHLAEEFVQLGVVGTEEYECATLLLYEFLYLVVVVALVLATDDEHGRGLHAFERIPACVDVGGLRVVDILHASHLAYLLQTVLHTGEVAETLAYHGVLDAADVACNTCCQ